MKLTPRELLLDNFPLPIAAFLFIHQIHYVLSILEPNSKYNPKRPPPIQPSVGHPNISPHYPKGYAPPLPSFDYSVPKNVTSLIGKTAYLVCKVKNLNNKTLSWVRHRDLHILTVGTYTYATDQRYQVIHRPNSEDWTLAIRWAQERDIGEYECQVNSQPIKSFQVYLHLVNPHSEILDGPIVNVIEGSTINLTCVVRYSPEVPAYIFWYHGDDANHTKVISFESERSGISIYTEKGNVTTSSLIIRSASMADSGIYSCSPSNTDVATIEVNVLKGDGPAAILSGCHIIQIPTQGILVCFVLRWILDH